MNMLLVLGTFIMMEGATWLIHKYIMHGFLWILHKDHHDHSSKQFLERNDSFFVMFAVPTIGLMYFGSLAGFNYLFFVGLGIMCYGAAYFLVHDVFIHQRFKLLRDVNSFYLEGLRRAHIQHHKHLGREQGECFGFLFVPFKYFRVRSKDNKR